MSEMFSVHLISLFQLARENAPTVLFGHKHFSRLIVNEMYL